MSSKDTPDIKYIYERGIVLRIFSAIMAPILVFMGLISLMALLQNQVSFGVFYIIVFSLGFIFSILSILRNLIIRKIFQRVTHTVLLSISDIIQKILYVIIAGLLITFLIAILTNYSVLLLSSLFLVCLFYPIMFIFTDIITYEGKIKIIFEQFYGNIESYSARQKWLRKISSELGESLRAGSIKIDCDYFVYSVNMELLKNRDVKGIFEQIKECLIDDKKMCYTTLHAIIPDRGFETYKHNSVLIQTAKNPAILKYVLAFLIFGILFIARPEQMNDLISTLFSRLIG